MRLTILVGLVLLIGGLSVSESWGLTGIVTAMDAPSLIITIKSGNGTIRFDLSSPVLHGYRNINHIRKGDRVQIDYTPGGIRLAKVGVAVAPPERPVSKPERRVSKVQRMRPRGKEFDDVDANRDGKISPVELSVIIPNLTMERFKQFDKNGDGSLDRAEFRSMNPGQ